MKTGTVFISANTAWNLFSRRRLLQALKDAGWNVVCLAKADDYSSRFQSELGMEFIGLPMRGDGTNVREDIRLFFAYLSLYRRRKPAFAFHINNKPNIYGSLAATLAGVPSAANVTGLGVVAEKKGLTGKIVYGLYRLAFASKKVFVFFQNNDDRSFFLEKKLASPDRAGVLPGSGVNCDLFVPETHKETSGQPRLYRFLFIGRLLVSKGIGVYIEAARSVKRLYPDAEFSIIGEHISSNPIYLAAEALDEAVTAGIVDYFGNVTNVESWVRNADCVVLPSWYREGVPRALLEAAAMGKPLIACDSVGTREPVENGVNGFLVAPKDSDALARSMVSFIELTDGEREAMGRESRRIAKARFSDRIIIESYLRVLSERKKDEK
jgi:glycosyltransferase involved in cell wall biosynthesis